MINDDNDDDWENSGPIVLNLEQLKQLQERKLIEESDITIAKELFEEDETLKEMRINELKESKIKLNETNTNSKNETKKNKKYESKKEENELKQKEISKKITKQKMLICRYHEIFGEAENNQDEYADYEDKLL